MAAFAISLTLPRARHRSFSALFFVFCFRFRRRRVNSEPEDGNADLFDFVKRELRYGALCTYTVARGRRGGGWGRAFLSKDALLDDELCTTIGSSWLEARGLASSGTLIPVHAYA